MHMSGTEYTDEQIKALAELLKDIVARRKIPPSDILAKSEVSPGELSDFPSIRDSVIALVYPSAESDTTGSQPN
jgi:N-acetyl-anhydromuramyl-L-alanine amidase AmpD